MKKSSIIIAHRGNTEGPNSSEENSPERIDYCIEKGFDVEVDLHYISKSKQLYLGHDGPEYETNWDWLSKRSSHLWIHCKTFEALAVFTDLNKENRKSFKYFWQQEDDYTITSNQLIWAYPGKPYNSKTIIAMPEWNHPNWLDLKKANCYGICTDYPVKLI